MARIVPKLNLNKTPQSVDNNSLIFAKNIKLLKDNTIGRDSGIDKINIDIPELEDYILVGYIPYNTVVYLFFYNSIKHESVIYQYDEKANTLEKCNTGWKYSGGIVEGMVTVNLRKDILLTINEYFENFDESENPLVPIKTINLSESKDDDDESIYSNAPVIPIVNLLCLGTYNRIIPNGVYQFFVRFEIIKDYYTSWFPCSEELFTANVFQSDTAQGTVRYIDTKLNSSESFVFSVQMLNTAYNNKYKGFQIGYILSSDDTIKAKTWKTFPMTTEAIYFDYDEEYTEDIEITELIRPVLNLYNVKNLTNFKNKFYISNYIESDYNKDLQDLVRHWTVGYERKTVLSGASWLYNGLRADVINVTYNDLTDGTSVSKTNDVIYKIGQFGDIRAIVDARNELLVGPFDYENGTRSDEHYNNDDSDTYNDFLWEDNNSPYFLEVNNYYIDNPDFPDGVESIAAKRDAIRRLYSEYTGDFQHLYDWLSPCVGLECIVPILNETTIEDYRDLYALADSDCIFKYTGGSVNVAGNLSPDNTEHIFTNRNNNFWATDGAYSFLIGYTEGFDTTDGKTIASYTTFDNPDADVPYTNKVTRFRLYYKRFIVPNSTDNEVQENVIYDQQTNKYKFKIDYTTYFVDISFNLNKDLIVKGSNFEKTNIKTLIPFQKYNFYIHFVKDTGEITNGYLITPNGYIQPYSDTSINHDQLLPKFIYDNGNNVYNNYKNTLYNYGYKYYFFSMCKIENQVAELFNKNIFDQDNSIIGGNNNERIFGTMFDCLDIDTLQMPLVDSIPIYALNSNEDKDKTDISQLTHYIGQYIDSGQLEPDCTRLFGASGKVVIKSIDLRNDGNNQYFIILQTKANTDILQLIKCTRFYKINEIDEFINNKLEVIDDYANLQDYVCTIAKKVDNELDKFISSSDYYEKGITILSGGSSNNEENNSDKKYTLNLTEIKEYMPYVHTNNTLIYSTFNLNFLELTNDVKRQIRRYEEQEDQTVVSRRQLTACFDSLTLSDLYTFPSMYKNYTRRYFDVYNKDSIIVYNNTIRSSELESDEAKTFVYKFLAEVSYNIPIDKGYIVNLISVGDSIIVHTQDSLYKFTGKVALSSADTNVQTVETDIFDIGIQEVVGSRYGFAGLKNKYHTLLSQYGYIFWDADCNVIYAYTGEGQITPISDPINKLLKYQTIKEILFSEDYYNDRFFIQIEYNDNSKLVLSYNIKAKSFVSLHDFSFAKTFNTKTNTYFIQNNKLYKLNNNTVGYNELVTLNSVYPSFTNLTKVSKPYAVIDVIINDNYEFIKTLDSISWICSEIDSLHIVPENDGYLFLAEESLNRTYPGNYLRIYTDTCCSELLEIIKSSNDYGFYKQLVDGEYKDVIQDDIVPKKEQRNVTQHVSENYKYPRYNLGKWSFNYFRNILNNKNKNNSDNNSLIYGKYFIFRFIFDVDVNFKFENLSTIINNNYGNN